MNGINSTLNLDQHLGHLVNKVSITLRKKLVEKFKSKSCDLTAEEFAILSRVWEEEGLFQSDLIEKTLKDKTRVTRLLNGLIEKGYVVKRVSPIDRRNYNLFLTSEGKTLKEYILPEVSDLMNTALIQIPPEDIEITRRTLEQMYKNLELEKQTEER